MKRRLQLILGLLAIAITVSLIAVTVGWYSVVNGEVVVEGSTATITTSDNNYHTSASLSCQGILSYDSQTATYHRSNYESYIGQSGLGEEPYILLFEVSEEFVGSSGYVNRCEISKPSEQIHEYDSSNSPFRVVLLGVVSADVYKEVEEGSSFQYIAIIFGDGESPFLFSQSEYKGTTFKLNVYFEN